MDTPGGHGSPTALKAARTLRRGWWIIALTTALIAGLAVYLSSREQPLYSASAEVLLKYQSLASGLTGIQDLSTVYQDPARIAETQTRVAMSPAVARRVAEKAKVPGLDADSFRGYASVFAEPDSDILDFTVTYPDPDIAERLATLHAREYINHRKELDTTALVAARKELQGRIEELQATRFRNSQLLARLVESEQQLRTMEALQTANASLLQASDGAAQIQPRMKRSAVLGIVLGLMLGIGLAFARDGLDTRLRSASEIGERLHLPLLARLPAPPRKLRKARRLITIADPHSPQSEAYRMLRANLEFVNLDRGAKSIIITSALEREGKSTTASNLAVSLARAGKNVALVDLDLRRPAIAEFFGIERGQPGVTSVVLGHSTLAAALFEVMRASNDAASLRAAMDPENGGNGDGPTPKRPTGVLKVLTAGQKPPDPGEFVNTPRLALILRDLEAAFDFVIVDTPPLLSVGDAVALSPHVDGLIAVTRLNLLRRPVLQEFGRSLAMCPTVKLGFIVTGAESEPGYEYAGYEYYGHADEFRAPASAPSRTGERV